MIHIGTKIGYLTITEELDTWKGDTKYKCKCDCGKERIVNYKYLLRSPSISCGCKNLVSKSSIKRIYEPQEASLRARASSYKSQAKGRGIPFTLTIEEAVKILKGICFYCGDNPAYLTNTRVNSINKAKPVHSIEYYAEYDVLYNGIDRMNNKLGYTIENSVSCCSKCNTAKLDMNLSDFKEWIIKVYNHLII